MEQVMLMLLTFASKARLRQLHTGFQQEPQNIEIRYEIRAYIQLVQKLYECPMLFNHPAQNKQHTHLRYASMTFVTSSNGHVMKR